MKPRDVVLYVPDSALARRHLSIAEAAYERSKQRAERLREEGSKGRGESSLAESQDAGVERKGDEAGAAVSSDTIASPSIKQETVTPASVKVKQEAARSGAELNFVTDEGGTTTAVAVGAEERGVSPRERSFISSSRRNRLT